MRSGIAVVFALFFLTTMCFSQVIPPINLNAELMQAGQVALTWDAPPDGLAEDFEDGVAQDFQWAVFEGSYLIEDGMAKIDVSNNGFPNWGSGAYMAYDFDNMTVSVTFEYVSGDASRGLLFRGNGPKDEDYNGYGFWIAHTLHGYSLWKYIAGDPLGMVPWTDCPEINEGQGAVNTLSVTAIGNTFDLYVNGTYVTSTGDGSYNIGTVGIVTAYGNEVWFDDITAYFTGVQNSPAQHARIGTPITGYYDDLGLPIDEPIAQIGAPVFDRFGQGNVANELDEFIEYRIYRDGVQVGTSDTETYTDQLPALGDFEYTVTAFYDEGESSHAGPALISWEAVLLDLIGVNVLIPPEGGTVDYAAHLTNTLPMTFRHLDYWTSVQLPNGQEFSPTSFHRIIIPGFVDITITGLTQDVPAESMPGIYTLTGHVGRFPNSLLSDSFTFEKQGAGVDGYTFDPNDWKAGGNFNMTGNLVESEDVAAGVPDAYALSEAYPNPFNPSTSFSVMLPEASQLTVTVYNITGQQVATLAEGLYDAGNHDFTFDAAGLSSGLYFIHASVAGKWEDVRKLTLLH